MDGNSSPAPIDRRVTFAVFSFLAGVLSVLLIAAILLTAPPPSPLPLLPARPRPAQTVDDTMPLENQPPVAADTPIGITLTINGQRRELQVAPWTRRHQGACAAPWVGGKSSGSSPPKTKDQPKRSASVT